MSAIDWSRLAAIRTWVLVLAGMVGLTVAASMWHLEVGIAVASVSCILLAYLTDDTSSVVKR